MQYIFTGIEYEDERGERLKKELKMSGNRVQPVNALVLRFIRMVLAIQQGFASSMCVYT